MIIKTFDQLMGMTAKRGSYPLFENPFVDKLLSKEALAYTHKVLRFDTVDNNEPYVEPDKEEGIAGYENDGYMEIMLGGSNVVVDRIGCNSTILMKNIPKSTELADAYYQAEQARFDVIFKIAFMQYAIVFMEAIGKNKMVKIDKRRKESFKKYCEKLYNRLECFYLGIPADESIRGKSEEEQLKSITADCSGAAWKWMTLCVYKMVIDILDVLPHNEEIDDVKDYIENLYTDLTEM